jgi:hypothetical protein
MTKQFTKGIIGGGVVQAGELLFDPIWRTIRDAGISCRWSR